MTDTPPVLMLIERPSQWMMAGLEGRYALTDTPGPGIAIAITGGGEGIDAATIDACPDLKLIAVCAVGYDKVDVAHAKARGIAVTYTPDVLTDDVADLALALMLAVFRKVPQYDAYVREGRWAAQGTPPLTRSLTGRRIGILGLGRIGHAIAERVRPIAGEIRYFSRTRKHDAAWAYEGDPVALAAWAEVLVVAVAGGAGTQGLVDARVIEALGPEGVLINIARGSVVDEAALLAALEGGGIAAAGLDVFASEPALDPRFLALENAVLAPHYASLTHETRAAIIARMLRDIAAFRRGEAFYDAAA